MNISSDMLNLLYQQSISSVNTNNANSANATTALVGDNPFSKLLSEVISKNLTNENTTTTPKSEEDNNNITLALSQLMQQMLGSSLTGYQNYDIFNTLQDSSTTGIDSLNGITDNLSLYSGTSNVDKLIETLQALTQNANKANISELNDNQESVVQTTAVKSDSSSKRIFPTEIMESINAARQAHEQIRMRINQIREFTGRAKVGQVEVASTNEDFLVSELANAEFKDLKLTLVPTDNYDVSLADSILDLNEIESLRQAVLNTESVSANQNVKTDEELNISEDKPRVDIVDESILNTDALNTSEVQINKEVSKLDNDFASIKDSVFDQIKNKVTTMKTDGKQTVTMHLKPEELGKLDIKMVLEKGNLSIEILTSNTKAHDLILSNITELENILKNSISSDRNYMNMENAKQLTDENARQNNQGFNGQNSQQEQNSNKNQHEQVYNISSDDSEKLDFYTAFSKVREVRNQFYSIN